MSFVQSDGRTAKSASARPFEPRRAAARAGDGTSPPGTRAAVRAVALAGFATRALSGCASSATTGEKTTGGGEACLVLPDLGAVTIIDISG